jgi:hypothetical protein
MNKGIKHILNILLFLLFISVLFKFSFAQDGPTYSAFYTGNSQNSIDTAYWVVVDPSGNSYVTGVSDGCYATIKYSPTLAQLWVSRYPQNNSGHHYSACCIDIQQQTYDKIYVTGYTYNAQYGYSQITTIAYYTSNGGVNWISNFYSLSGNCEPRMVKCDVAGNVYVVGYYTYDRSKDFVVLKYAPNGILSSSWPDNGHGVGVRTYAGPEGANDIATALDISGEIVYVTGSAVFAPFDNREVTIAYNSDGSELWNEPAIQYSYGLPPLNEIKNNIAADFNNGVYVTCNDIGQHMLTVKYDPSTGTFVNSFTDYNGYGWGSSISYFSKRIGNSWAHTNDIFVTGTSGGLTITKLNENFQHQWTRQFNGFSTGYSLALSLSEDVCVAGYKATTFPDMYILKYSSNGGLLLSQEYNGSGNGSDCAYCVALDIYGNPIVTGLCRGNNTNDDFATLKYVLKSSDGDNVNPNIPIEFKLNQNYPNPFNPSTQINYSIPSNGFVTLKVYDMLGREIKELVNEYKEAGNYNVTFDGSNLSSGLYFYKLTAGNYSDVKKMTLIK